MGPSHDFVLGPAKSCQQAWVTLHCITLHLTDALSKATQFVMATLFAQVQPVVLTLFAFAILTMIELDKCSAFFLPTHSRANPTQQFQVISHTFRLQCSSLHLQQYQMPLLSFVLKTPHMHLSFFQLSQQICDFDSCRCDYGCSNGGYDLNITVVSEWTLCRLGLPEPINSSFPMKPLTILYY